MENLFETIKCIECKCILQSPIVLPCGKSVCQKHITSQQQQHYFCHSCAHNHIIPETGFAANNAVQLLIDLNLGGYKQAYNACEQLKSALGELEALHADPLAQIALVISALKGEIRTRRDQMIVEIEQKSEHLIVDLESYQRECASALSRLKGGGGVLGKSLESKIEKKRTRLDVLRDELADLETANGMKWKSILERSEAEMREINASLEQIRRMLLLNKLEKFKEKNDLFCQIKLFDCLKKTEKPIKNEVIDFTERIGAMEALITPNSDSSQIITERADDDTVTKSNSSGNGAIFHYDDSMDEDDGDDEEYADFDDDDDDEDENEEGGDDKNDEENVGEVVGLIEERPSSSSKSNKKSKRPKRLSYDEVEEIFKAGDRSLKNFGTRLIRSYFTFEELSVKNVSILGRGARQRLDPIRVGYIKKHLEDRNGGVLSDKQWSQCRQYMKGALVTSRYKKAEPSQKSITSSPEQTKSHKQNTLPRHSKKRTLNSKKLNTKKGTAKRLDDAEVEKVYISGERSLKNFAGRLFPKYFSKNEIIETYTGYGRTFKQLFDPIRIGYIKEHLIKRKGAPLSVYEWQRCQNAMRCAAWHIRKAWNVKIKMQDDK